MSKVYETITLKNGADIELAALGQIDKSSVRQIDVKVLVDTGAHPALIIPEAVSQKLGVRITGTKKVTVAGGTTRQCSIVGPIELWWHDRDTIVPALVLPGEPEAIMGITTLELLDLAVDPINGRLFGVHGEEMLLSVK
jgi:clan AA aspartic protease